MADSSSTNGAPSIAGRRHVRTPQWEDMVASLRSLSEATRERPLAAARLRRDLSVAMERTLNLWLLEEGFTDD